MLVSAKRSFVWDVAGRITHRISSSSPLFWLSSANDLCGYLSSANFCVGCGYLVLMIFLVCPTAISICCAVAVVSAMN